MSRTPLLAGALVVLLAWPLFAAEPGVGALTVHPASATLRHPARPQSLLVSVKSPVGYTLDLTAQATYASSNPRVATVTSLGWVQPVANGSAEITVSAAGQSAKVAVVVQLPDVPPAPSFRHDVMPVLSKASCNMGACHGYSLGKNGFKLSLRGADPEFDFKSLTEEFFERRVNRHHPAASLVVTKPLGDVPHKGGVRFDRGSLLHDLLLDWIAAGAPADAETAPLVSVSIHPERAVVAPGGQQQFQLLARYADGAIRDVTRLGIYTANVERVASVDDEGLANAVDLGESPIVARFERMFATANLVVLKVADGFQPAAEPGENLVDKHVGRKLADLHVRPSEVADDATFLRRVYVDLIGLQPTAPEIAAFIADASPQKRTAAIDALFERPEFVDQWSLKWGDLLQNSRNKLAEPAVYAFREWIRAAVAENMPLDRFARELLMARGGSAEHPAAAYYVVSKDTDDTIQRLTQVFCGVRMLCAKCHAHPFENWTQDDYYGLHSFFNQVATKPDPRLPGVKDAKAVVVNRAAALSRHPRTGQAQPARFLGGGEPTLPADADRREAYAEWLTAKNNPFFARSLTNRLWSYFFHRGIIDPVDDLRSTNPPVNPELLDALTKDFVDRGFDARHLMRTIVTSRTYQRSSLPNETNAHDDLNFSRSVPRRLPAETLLDSLVQATGVAESFRNAPAGFSAKQLPDANVQSEFLLLFGKPQRMESCECERDDRSNMLQALHFINGKSILSRVVAPNGRVLQLAKQHAENRPLVEQLYLWSLCRLPNEKESLLAEEFFRTHAGKREEAAQDLMWALLNSKDFMLVH